MADPPSSPATPPKSNLPIIYYALVVVAAAAIVLVLYNIIVLKWCAHHTVPQSNHRSRQPIWSANNSTVSSAATFKYKRDGKLQDDCECAVCLSAFEEGDGVRQLPRCKHYFHTPCIDMWLYSHMDCPLCRSPVEESEHSREGLLA